jgi:MtN3 and saliva related transmembrane protein
LSIDTSVIAIGFLAAALTTGSWIPQALRTIRRNSARDFSWAYLVAITVGVWCWCAYGLLRHDAAVVAANAVTAVFLVPILIVKWFEQRNGHH